MSVSQPIRDSASNLQVGCSMLACCGLQQDAGCGRQPCQRAMVALHWLRASCSLLLHALLPWGQWPSTFSKAGGMLQSGSANLSCSFARKGAGMPPPPTAQMHGHTRFCSPVSLLFVGQGKAAALRHLFLTTYPTLV